MLLTMTTTLIKFQKLKMKSIQNFGYRNNIKSQDEYSSTNTVLVLSISRSEIRFSPSIHLIPS